MLLKRRQAITLTSTLALSSFISDRASACSRPIRKFKSDRRDEERMAEKFDNLKYHWNKGTIRDFLAIHCVENVDVNFILEGRGGSWSEPEAIEIFIQRYPKIISGFSGVMAPLNGNSIYACAEFEEHPLPAKPDEEILLCESRNSPQFAIELRFATNESDGVARVSLGRRIVSGLSLRPTFALRQLFSGRR